MPVSEGRVSDSTVTVLTPRVALRWTWTHESFEGRWRIGDRTGVLQGRRMPAEPDNSLRPVPCRVAGLGEVVRCATLFVAENAADPESRLISLNIVILPARAEPAAGALYHFAGGPGQAATQMAGGNARRFAKIREQRDIVMVDQRGTGGSNGLMCEFETLEERASTLFAGFFAEETATRCRDALGRRADLSQYHTAVAAEDVEQVRAWLGYGPFDLYGGSYGTRAALAYLRAHPEGVRTVTLRGIMAPSGSLVLDNPRAAQATLEMVFRDCAAQHECYAAFPALGDEFAAVMRQLEAEPAPVLVRDPVTGDSVTLAVTQGVFAGSVRRMLMDSELLRRVPLAVHEAAEGSFATFLPGIERTLGMAGALFWGMGLSVVCAEDLPMIRGQDVERAAAASFMGHGQVDGLLRVCPTWPAGTPPAGYDQPVHGNAPALLLSGALDPTTPPRWGEEVARGLPQGVHVVMTGVSHSPFPQCAMDVMAAMVEAGTTDGLDRSRRAQQTGSTCRASIRWSRCGS
jgi:pimeloyl-ACP methyl ester carboxylesterase